MHPLQKVLIKVQQEEGLDFEIRSYSGRFMYGEECLAITGDVVNMLQLGWLIKFHDHKDEVYFEHLERTRTDSMGLGIVLYFPGIRYTDPDLDEGVIRDED